MTKPWKDWSDDDLADEAQRGLQGQGAIVEAMRRHRSALLEEANSNTRLARVALFVALVGIGIAFAQLFI